MTQRLALLLLALVAITALRWSDPFADSANEVVQAAAPRSAAKNLSPSSPGGLAAEAIADISAGTRRIELADARDAFAVRTPPPPVPAAPPPPPPRPQPVAPPVIAAPVVQAPVAPPLQVIGTWRDERGLSVFVVGPGGVVQARVGDTLLTEYQVTQVSAQQLQLRHLSSQRDIALAVPASRSSPTR